MKALRIAAAAAVIAAGAWASATFVFRPIACYRLKGQLYASSYRAFENRDERGRTQARANLEKLEMCLAPGCRNIPLFFLLAINNRTIDRHDAALGWYREALRYDKRPEIYANIGDTELAMGNREEAYQNYLTAALFFPAYLRLIDDPALQARVRDEILERHPGERRAIERVLSPEAGRRLRRRGF